MKNKKIAIIGATGFTGSELVRLLHHHPLAKIALITSESRAGESFSDVHPFFEGIVDIELQGVSAIDNTDIDLAFLALPHGVSMDYVADFQQYNFPVIDLSGDFRLRNPDIYETWYHHAHSFPEGFDTAVYGLPELFADSISASRLIANPGCYPTSVILGAAPLLKAGLADPDFIIADCKSGVTGAGVKAKPVNHFSNVNDNFKAYGLKNHRHSIEIEEQLSSVAGKKSTVQFTPHLLPVDRGILSTLYLKPLGKAFDQKLLEKTFRDFYAKAPFMRLLDRAPEIKNVRGTNYCDLYATYDERTGNILVITAIDNLVKGAAGQAVQNMNLIFGWEQTLGLQQVPMVP